MHIPDGFLDYSICGITYLGSALFWILAFRKSRESLKDQQIPLMATLTPAHMPDYEITSSKGNSIVRILPGFVAALFVLGLTFIIGKGIRAKTRAEN